MKRLRNLCDKKPSASCDTAVCPQLTQAPCPSVLSDNGAVIQYIPKPVKSHAYTLPQLPPGMKLPENPTRYICTRPACLSDPCLHQSQCTETDDGFNCTCLDGWQGTRCEKAVFIETVRILGGNRNEGRIVFAPRYSPDKFRLVRQNEWTVNASRLVCQYLGFQGFYGTVNGNFYGESSQDVYAKVGVVSCPTNSTNITDCWMDEETDDGVDATIGIVCCSESPSMFPGTPLGLESGAIPDSSITASSCYDGQCTQDARLNGPESWSTSVLNTFQWLQVQFGSNYLVSGIITQGRASLDQYVTSYKLSYSLDSIVWTDYMDSFTSSVKPQLITRVSSVHSIKASLSGSKMVGFLIQIDLGEEYIVTGVVTQGRSNAEQWATSMYISTSLDDTDWVFTTDPLSRGPKVYPANYDRNSHVTSLLPKPVRARYVRFHPITSMNFPSMRVEVLGHVI
ncbi:lactadherin-like [Diadema antillarum]|uniref:lactadherin-like n=1 Tax=Diadema antillarum TaxID=105358 RepID=UPI003A8B0E29